MTEIGPSTILRGALESSDDVVIHGQVRGDVTGRDAIVTVGDDGHVTGSIRARVVVVTGRVEGNITAGQRIELTATARVDGDLSSDVVVLADGARFNGHIDMNRRTIAARVAHYMARAAGQATSAAHPQA